MSAQPIKTGAFDPKTSIGFDSEGGSNFKNKDELRKFVNKERIAERNAKIMNSKITMNMKRALRDNNSGEAARLAGLAKEMGLDPLAGGGGLGEEASVRDERLKAQANALFHSNRDQLSLREQTLGKQFEGAGIARSETKMNNEANAAREAADLKEREAQDSRLQRRDDIFKEVKQRGAALEEASKTSSLRSEINSTLAERERAGGIMRPSTAPLSELDKVDPTFKTDSPEIAPNDPMLKSIFGATKGYERDILTAFQQSQATGADPYQMLSSGLKDSLEQAGAGGYNVKQVMGALYKAVGIQSPTKQPRVMASKTPVTDSLWNDKPVPATPTIASIL